MRPVSKEEAAKYRYSAWAGNERGIAYDRARCAEEVTAAHSWIPYQCRRPNGHGMAGLYCKQHAKRFPSETGKGNLG
jgi:hypothetical protein